MQFAIIFRFKILAKQHEAARKLRILMSHLGNGLLYNSIMFISEFSTLVIVHLRKRFSGQK